MDYGLFLLCQIIPFQINIHLAKLLTFKPTREKVILNPMDY